MIDKKSKDNKVTLKRPTFALFFAHFCVLYLCTFPFMLRGEITKFEVLNSQKTSFSFAEVCASLASPLSGNQSTLPLSLIDVIDINRLDCMGKPLSVQDFCYGKMEKKPDFMRGLIDQKEKKVLCQTGDRVILQLNCAKLPSSVHCLKAQEDCLYLKESLARNLSLHHSSITTHTTYTTHSLSNLPSTEDKKVINCHFVKKDFFSESEKEKNSAAQLLQGLY